MKKGNQDISKVILKGILLSGVFVAILAMSTTTFQISQYLCDSQETEQSKENGDKETEAQETLKSFEAITTSAQIHLEHEYLLIDILPELINEIKVFSSTEDQIASAGKVLKILFRQFISPNAP